MKRCLIVFILFLSSCVYDPAPAIIRVVNHTNHNVNVVWNSDVKPVYPSVNHTDFYYDNVLMVNDTLDAAEDGANGWKKFLLNSKSKKVYFFIFETDSLKKYKSIDDLIIYKRYKRFEYSAEELNKLNWVVVIKD